VNGSRTRIVLHDATTSSMQHSYEGLDRAGGTARTNLLGPLRHRDFRRLWSGMTLSLVGDGAFLVAMTWQVYTLSNAPTALAFVGIAMSVPTIVLLLVGGAVSDRIDRRRLMVTSDLIRAGAVGLLAVLTLTGALALWHVVAVCAVYGAATAFFNPAFDAIVPDLLPAAELAQANALDQLVRPIAFRLLGPALGGWLVAGVGAGSAFALDATTFAVSAVAVASMRYRRIETARSGASIIQEIREGFAFVRAHTWMWGTLVAAAFAYLAFMGPTEVLLPYIVKNDLGGSASDLGLVFAAGGLGAILSAIICGARGLPRRNITCMYLVWTAATLSIAGYGLAQASWQLMVACFMFNLLETAGTIIWATAKQRHVPPNLLGRVSSFDWLISIGLLPLSFALTGPISSMIGARATLIWAGIAGSAVTLAALFLPGMRAIEDASSPAGSAQQETVPEARTSPAADERRAA
jgi:DHA3 family tetracycline resistance protein-like MFS transporter